MSKGQPQAKLRVPITERLHAQSVDDFVVPASYERSPIAGYAGNPHIEALPPIRSGAEVLSLVTHLPPVDLGWREMPPEHLSHITTWLRREFHLGLPHHVDLYDRMSRLVRQGYSHRNPVLRAAQGNVESAVRDMESTAWRRRGRRSYVVPAGMTVMGISGVGKSCSILGILDLLPQVIQHVEYQGRSFIERQVVWMRVACPEDGSLVTFLQSCLEELDAILGTEFYAQEVRHRATKNTLRSSFARVAASHGLGILIIDEAQRTLKSREGADHLLNFFVEFVNKLGIPIVLVGTPTLFKVLDDFQLARRGTSEGDFLVSRLSQDGPGAPEWQLFCDALWRYQLTRSSVSLRGAESDAIRSALFRRSQGIADLVVKLFFEAQLRAVQLGDQVLMPAHIESVARDRFTTVIRQVRALAEQDEEALKIYGDLDVLERLGREAEPSSIDLAFAGGTDDVSPRDGVPNMKSRAPRRRTNEERVTSHLHDVHDAAIDTLPKLVRDALASGISAHAALSRASVIVPASQAISALVGKGRGRVT